MTYKNMFDKAFKALDNGKRRRSDSEFAAAVRKRARSGGPREYRRPHRLLNAAGAVAGTAAVLTGAVFGLKFLNEHGGLREGGIDTGAAYHSGSTYFATPTASANKSLSELVGKTLKYSHAEVNVTGAVFDGQVLRLDYSMNYDEGSNPFGFTLEPMSYVYNYSVENIKAYTPIYDKENRYVEVIQFIPLSLDAFKDYDLVPEMIPREGNIERIDELSVTIRREDNKQIYQYLGDNQEIEPNVWCAGLNITPLTITMQANSKDPKATGWRSDKRVEPEIFAIANDGTRTALNMQTVSLNAQGNPDVEYEWEGVYLFYPDDIGIDLTKMKAFEINGKITELTGEARHMITTVLENGEIVEATTITAVTTAPLETGDPAEESSEDTTTAPSHLGYYEGEAALDILKQYAGGDYCYPLEEQITDDVKYRTHDEWTGPDISGDYRFTIKAQDGDLIFAVTGGTVVDVDTSHRYANSDSEYKEGFYVTIQSPDGRKWRYSHCSTVFVNVGDIVKAGDKIAAVGLTGFTTGAHLAISFPGSEIIDPEQTTE
ncbi:MAG: M23 family metallopeptidase [Ruminiclostridium sp.]|nr:M23 family metallopeptidase [Ruminiclostridium sp.]